MRSPMPILDDLHQMVSCPHGNETCPCPDDLACHYEGADAWICPNPPDGWKGLTFAHCHVEGCTWVVDDCAQTRVRGECGLMKLGYPAAGERPNGDPYWSMSQAVPGEPGWACGWLRTSLNVGWRQGGEVSDADAG